ncbi:MAG: hypothetical protein V4486_02410 [Patescibacteria group bacterium]
MKIHSCFTLYLYHKFIKSSDGRQPSGCRPVHDASACVQSVVVDAVPLDGTEPTRRSPAIDLGWQFAVRHYTGLGKKRLELLHHLGLRSRVAQDSDISIVHPHFVKSLRHVRYPQYYYVTFI